MYTADYFVSTARVRCCITPACSQLVLLWACGTEHRQQVCSEHWRHLNGSYNTLALACTAEGREQVASIMGFKTTAEMERMAAKVTAYLALPLPFRWMLEGVMDYMEHVSLDTLCCLPGLEPEELDRRLSQELGSCRGDVWPGNLRPSQVFQEMLDAKWLVRAESSRESEAGHTVKYLYNSHIPQVRHYYCCVCDLLLLPPRAHHDSQSPRCMLLQPPQTLLRAQEAVPHRLVGVEWGPNRQLRWNATELRVVEGRALTRDSRLMDHDKLLVLTFKDDLPKVMMMEVVGGTLVCEQYT